jgi:hypothetical protein
MFGNTPAVGRHFLQMDKSNYEIVGVVEDGKYESLTEDPTPAMFFPLPQNREGNTTLVVRSQLPPEQVTPALNRILMGIDSSLPFYYSAVAGQSCAGAVPGTRGHGCA